MSISEAKATDFDRWIVEEFAASGPFTAFVILVEIAKRAVTPLCSTYFSVIGDDIDWEEVSVLFAGSGRNWNGVSFFAATAIDGGPLDSSAARSKLLALEGRINENRLVLNEGHFFDQQGRRLKVEEVQAP